MPAPKSKLEEQVSSVEKNYVYIKKSVTKNMGDFNSAKITIGVRLSVNPTKEEIAAAKATLVIGHEIVDEQIEEQTKALLV